MKRHIAYAKLEQFWTARTDGSSAALFRIAFGTLSLWTSLGIILNRKRYFSDGGLVPWDIVKGYDWAGWSLFVLAPRSGWLLDALCVALVIASLGLVVGFAPRACALLVFVIHVSLHHRNPYIFNSGDRLFLMLAALGACLPLGRVFSLQARLRGDRPAGSPAPIWSQRLIQLQICHIYWFSCFSKLRHARWRHGVAIQDVLSSPLFSEWPVDLSFSPLLRAMLTWSTLLFEFGFPIAVWHPRTRLFALVLGVVFHLGIEITMIIPMFSAIMIVSYALFLTDREAARALALFEPNRAVKTS
jgi:hypothetical protein